MCLITFAIDAHPDYPFIFAANRDEFYDRPTRAAAFWDDAPNVLGGRDERAGGTWCGIRRDGRFACVTNYREPPVASEEKISRGALTTHFLIGDEAPDAYIREVHNRRTRYAGFNLLIGDHGTLHYYSNRIDRPKTLEPGVYALSNDVLDVNWPKVERARDGLRAVVDSGHVLPPALFEILLDRTAAPDDQLPDTGFGRAWERVLSPIFIATDDYGTRSSTVVLQRSDGSLLFEEMQHEPGQPAASTRRFEW